MIDRLIEKFTGNPGKWILIGLLCISVYSNYKLGKNFTQFCSDVSEFTDIFEYNPELLQQISHISVYSKKYPSIPSTDRLNRMADMHEKLMNGSSDESYEYRYRYYLLNNIMSVCSDRLSPTPYDDYEYD